MEIWQIAVKVKPKIGEIGMRKKLHVLSVAALTACAAGQANASGCDGAISARIEYPEAPVQPKFIEPTNMTLLTVAGVSTVYGYLPVEKGRRYAIIVENSGPTDIAVAVLVDGLNAFTQKSVTGPYVSYAVTGNDKYVVKAHTSVIIDGWRTPGSDIVDSFLFTSHAESVVGHEADFISPQEGTIVLAVFASESKTKIAGDASTDSSGEHVGTASGDMQIATGKGPKIHIPIGTVPFKLRSDTACGVVFVRYASETALRGLMAVRSGAGVGGQGAKRSLTIK